MRENKKTDRENKRDKKALEPKRTSTTQGGSNHGQGSMALAGKEAYTQGSESNDGANYDNEAGRLSKETPIRKTKK